MALIESVAMRQRGGLDFEMHYENLCALGSSCPIPAVKAHLKQNVLDLNGDRIRTNDWLPIFNTIKINRTLEYIAIRSFYQQQLDAKDPRSSAKKLKVPAIRSKDLTLRLCRALKNCLEVNPALRCIEIQGLPLRLSDTEALAKGIGKSTSLQHLSFENTGIGDEQVAVLCRAMKNTMSIMSVNFSGCSLTWRSAEALADVIKHQATERHSEAWKDSLRYRRPDLDRMAGLRRITANTNPLFGDKGAQALADVLRDDLWVKAVDLHQCGISEEGAKALLEILKINTTLVVMDVRSNPLIGKETMTNIMDQVCINSAGHETEYKWIKLNQTSSETPSKVKQRKKRARLLQGYSRKSNVRVSGSYLNKRPRTTPSMAARGSPSISSDYMKPGTPWRTALRAAQYRGEMPDRSTSRLTLFESLNDASGPMDQSDWAENVNYDNVREIKAELELLRRNSFDEITQRTSLEKKVQMLESENVRLRQQVSELQAKRSFLEDDRILDSIEQSFRQFNEFLDQLRDLGLGDYITRAGVDQAKFPFLFNSEAPSGREQSPPKSFNRVRSFLEQSIISQRDTSILSDRQPDGLDSSFHREFIFRNKPANSQQSAVSSAQNHNESQVFDDKPRKTSRFDELYQKALRNTENILQRKEFQVPHDEHEESRRSEMPKLNGSAQHPADTQLQNGNSEKAVLTDDDGSERSKSISVNSGRRQASLNKPDSDSPQESLAKSSKNFEEPRRPLPASDGSLEQRLLSDRSEKSASSRGTNGSRTRLAATVSELQDNRQTGKMSSINESGANESYDTVDEHTISDESNLEEVIDLNDSDMLGNDDD